MERLQILRHIFPLRHAHGGNEQAVTNPLIRSRDIATEAVLTITTEILAKRIDPVNWPQVQNDAYAQAQAEYVARAVNGPAEDDK
jgi:hypothetical protein